MSAPVELSAWLRWMISGRLQELAQLGALAPNKQVTVALTGDLAVERGDGPEDRACDRCEHIPDELLKMAVAERHTVQQGLDVGPVELVVIVQLCAGCRAVEPAGQSLAGAR